MLKQLLVLAEHRPCTNKPRLSGSVSYVIQIAHVFPVWWRPEKWSACLRCAGNCKAWRNTINFTGTVYATWISFFKWAYQSSNRHLIMLPRLDRLEFLWNRQRSSKGIYSESERYSLEKFGWISADKSVWKQHKQHSPFTYFSAVEVYNIRDHLLTV